MHDPRQHEQGGFALAVLLASLLPILLIVGAAAIAMTGRANELRTELDQERALLAAESGVDEAVYRGQIGTLLSGYPWSRSLGTDTTYQVTPTYLGTDTIDNDGDTAIDEADEDVFQVVVLGTYRNAKRRLAAYLGSTPLLPTIPGAVLIHNPSPTIEVLGSSLITGTDTNLDDSLTGSALPGLLIADPNSTAVLLAELSLPEQSQVTGAGGPPSLGTTPPIDLTTLVGQLQNAADIVLTSDNYNALSFGSGAGGVAHVTYRNGNVRFGGSSQGAGVLVVTGDLTLSGNFRFDGVIIVLGDLENLSGSPVIYGSVVLGPLSGRLETSGSVQIKYSSQAIAVANGVSGRYVAFNGWQELAR